MGNCLRSGSPTASNDHHRHHRLPAHTHASSTSFSTAKSHFSTTVSEGNCDTDTDYTSATSHFPQTVAEGNESPDPSVPDAWSAVRLKEGLSNLKAFTFAELKTATGNFEKQNFLGEGAFGKVFKGWIDERSFAPSKPASGMVVVVKKIKPEILDLLGNWESEVSILGRLSHPNLIKLLGLCSETVEKTEELLLVYEFVPNGSLADHLFRENLPTEPLSWNSRLKIAIGAGRGMAFLHMSQVIHRNFNSSSVLLDGNYNAKLTGFGLARVGPTKGHSYVSTVVWGTDGYVAPEYLATGYLYVKSDVYGFGVVLLEIMTGLRAFDAKRHDGQKYLVEWLKPTLTNRNRVKDIMDARMEGQYSSEAMLRSAQITSRCLEQNPRSRPSMDEVLQALEQIESI